MADGVLTALLVGCAVLVPFVLLVWGSVRVLRELKPEKRRDVLVGVIGIIFLNLGFYLAFSLSKGQLVPLSDLPALLPWAINLVPILVLAVVRRWMAIGALLFLGFLLAWVFLAGALFFVSCLLVGALGAALGFW